MPTRKIDDAVDAIADGASVEWDTLERSAPDATDAAGLRLLDDVARAFRESGSVRPDAARAPQFRWGPLEVHERIGVGSYGEVYRAFDPWLGRRVALKLRRVDISTRAGDPLEEARRVARVRHHNVLSVYGCALHDGRAGLWSELVDGETLADIVARCGKLDVHEALRVGRDLARALAAIHAAGLVHGDVKAANVMREAGGRIVLMDFGAGGDERLVAARRLLIGTPAYLPPEALAGAPLGNASDLYALGVLVFFLLTGRFPYSATAADALGVQQAAGQRERIATLRPDLDADVAALIERCIDVDPRRRPGSATEAMHAFDEVLHRDRTAGTRRLALFGSIAGLVALVAIGAALLWPHLFPPAWSAKAAFVRSASAGSESLADGARVATGDRLRLSVTTNRPVWIYVLNEDADGVATVLYPLADASANPQVGNETVELPGGRMHPELAWEVGADSEREEFVVIASLRPRDDLENVVADWRRAAAATRSVDSLVAQPPARIRGAHLRELLDAAASSRTEDVHVWTYVFAHAH